MVKLFVKGLPYAIEEAENGLTTLDLFKTGSFDLVLMDIQMPERDDLEATAAIRAWEQEQRQAPTPIVALTGNTFKEDMSKALATGCAAYVTKPIKKQVLLDAIRIHTSPPLSDGGLI